MALPSVWPAYARMLTLRRPPLAPPGTRVRGAIVAAQGVIPPAADLAAYRRTCGFPPAGPLPITYPHALAMPLHLALVTGPAFPVRFLGLVHLRNLITAHQPLPDREPLELRCAVEGPRETERGQEYDLLTEVRYDGALAWTETAVVLARAPGAGGGRRAPPAAAAPADASPVARWEVPADQGRRYAAAAGDWNPIHLSAPTARLFGFPRAIAHGMWSLARCLAELGVPEGPCTVETTFKLPVFLPGTVTLHTAREGGRTTFALRDADGAKPHLTGAIGAG